MKWVDFLMDLISYLYDGFLRLQTYVHFLRAFLKKELNMNAQVGCSSRKVENYLGLIGSIWEKHIYFYYPRPEAANTEPDPCPRHTEKFWTQTRSGLGSCLGFLDPSGPVKTSSLYT